MQTHNTNKGWSVLSSKAAAEKARYEIKAGNHIIEVDEFYGDNEGLIVAEIELKSENEVFEKPHWIAEEVTGDIKYYNSQLSKQPYKEW